MAEITFRGNPIPLSGEPPHAGEPAPDFQLHRFSPEEGLVEVTLADLPAKPRLISVVPSLDTPVCSTQTQTFNQQLAELGDSVAAYTVSLDLPFAQARYCGAEGISNMTTLSDYQTGSFGRNWGMKMTEGMHLLARGVFVLDADGNVTYAQLVKEVGEQPDYDAALAALKDQVGAAA
jgi:thiol peroxidase